ncbi:MAG: NADH-quinone oxidoreductase subunit N [Candidatus Marinimicrobia bacterium]|nr:NADH-quinone oxidoreductase subunit N [Candidatus Neomarinimicrobiota bacterium]
MSNLLSLSDYLPEMILLGVILIAIVMDLVPATKRFTKGFILVGLILVAAFLYQGDTSASSLFMGMSAHDPFGTFFKWLFIIATFFVVLIAKYDDGMDQSIAAEFNILLLIVMFGLFLMATATNLVMVYLAIETVSISSYILAGMLRNDIKSNEASLKYVIFGAFASGLMLYGFSWLYGLSGSTDLTIIRDVLMTQEGPVFVVYISILMVLVGIGYKLSMVPFHYWTPDVYEGAPTPLTAYLSVAPKAAGLALMIRFFTMTFTDGAGETVANVDWTVLIAVLSAITMTVGNLLALRQENVKRLFAFSSIAHAGYMLMVIPVISTDSSAAIMFYLVPYLFMNLGAFFVAIAVSNHTGSYDLAGWKGLGKRTPLLAALMVIFLVSLTGLPPTAGFIGKVYLFSVLIKHQQFYWLAVVAVINSVIALFYYFRIVREMYFTDSDDTEPLRPHPILTWSIISCVIPVLVLGLYWSPVIDWVTASLKMF